MQSGKRNTIILLIATGVFVCLLLTLWFFFAGPGRKASVEIITVPSDASLTIDNKPAKTGKISLAQGEHTLLATRRYFGDATKKINTADLGDSEKIYLILDAATIEAERYMLEHPDEQVLYEAAIGAEFSSTQKSILERYPLVTQLPYKTLDFRITYSVDENKGISFRVELYPVATVPGTPEYKQQLEGFKADALGYLESQGLNTDKENISFVPDPDSL